MEQHKAIFFDRDGVLNYAEVINSKPYPPKDAQSLKIVENASELLAELKALGFLTICVTNQPDIARGIRTLKNVLEMNDKVVKEVLLDDLFFCPHDNIDNCDCRKPKSGMLIEAAKKWNIDLAQSYMIGDRKGDILAGESAGCRTVFIDYDYNEEKPEKRGLACRTLKEAVELILGEQNA